MTNEDKIIRKTFRIGGDDIPPLANHRFRSTRIDIAQLFNTLGYKIGAEVGVAKGRFSKVLSNHVDGLKLYCVDPWKSYDGFENITSQKRMDEIYNICLERLKGCNVEYMRMTTAEAIEHIPDGFLDFVYIDGGHQFDASMFDIISWSPKVRMGGIVSGRNYHSYFRSGQMSAVNAYTRAKNIKEWYVTSNRGRDPYRSWFWVKGEDLRYG
jgi:hypothetical protein